MNLFVVDEKKCDSCGICVEACFARIVEFKDKAQVPTPVDGADEICVNCGHCVAVCPHDALTLRTMSPEKCVPAQKELSFEREQAANLLRSRRSIRNFSDKAVDREVLADLIDVARFAPSGCNSQPVDWLVFSDREEIRQLAEITMDWIRSFPKELPQFLVDRSVHNWNRGIDAICWEAPHIIITHAPKGKGKTGCTIALTYLELTALYFGLGSCWAGLVNLAANEWVPMRQFLALPKGHTSCGAMMIGYPKYRYHRIPLRNDARVNWR
ncbi:NAD(P)H-quinone oxidoreductase subunit I, chloroplastic [subsurface metagenome]